MLQIRSTLYDSRFDCGSEKGLKVGTTWYKMRFIVKCVIFRTVTFTTVTKHTLVTKHLSELILEEPTVCRPILTWKSSLMKTCLGM